MKNSEHQFPYYNGRTPTLMHNIWKLIHSQVHTHTPPPFSLKYLAFISRVLYSLIDLDFKASAALAMYQLCLCKNAWFSRLPGLGCSSDTKVPTHTWGSCPGGFKEGTGASREILRTALPWGKFWKESVRATFLIVLVSCILAQPIMPSIIFYMNAPTTLLIINIWK